MIAGVLLFSAAALLLGSVVTIRAPGGPLASLEGYLSRWASLHQGYDPRGNAWVSATLRITFVVARPLARGGVHPDALTLWSLWLALAAFASAGAGGRWPLLAAALVVASGFGDALDGAVAAVTGRATRWGFVVDSVADRVSEAVFLLAVWAAGAPAGVAVTCGVAFGLLEYARARAATAGLDGIGAVTVAERPVRVALCAAALVAAGVAVDHAAVVAGCALGVLALLSAVALAQFLVAAHRALAGPLAGARGPSGRSDEAGDDAGRQEHERQPATGVRRAADEEEPRDG